MNDAKEKGGRLADGALDTAKVPLVVDRATWQAELDALRVREKVHTHEGSVIAAGRRRLPMVEVDASLQLVGPHGPVTLRQTFEGRRQLIAWYFMWQTGRPAAEQCEGCTYYTSQLQELSYLHSRDVTYATFCLGPYEESARYREFMGWQQPWYSAEGAAAALHAGPHFSLAFYVREGDRVFETFRTTGRGVEAMCPSYGLLDMTVYGRQEAWEDSPEGWPRFNGHPYRSNELGTAVKGFAGRAIAQWPRLEAGRSDDLGIGGAARRPPHGRP
jgi:predicted dithiol-disulfide oxidoreductase (DUF899 family)